MRCILDRLGAVDPPQQKNLFKYLNGCLGPVPPTFNLEVGSENIPIVLMELICNDPRRQRRPADTDARVMLGSNADPWSSRADAVGQKAPTSHAARKPSSGEKQWEATNVSYLMLYVLLSGTECEFD